jgi:hypothetical protein
VNPNARIPKVLLGTAILLAPDLASAQGGPPLRTDDPGTPSAGEVEINLALALDEASDHRLLRAPILDLNYGVSDHFQLKCEIPWVFLDEDGEDARNGLGNPIAGFKWRFLDARGAEPAMSIAPQVGFEPPASSSADRGIAATGTAILLPIQAAWDLEHVDVGIDFGRLFHDRGADGWIAGVALSRALSETCELAAEIFGDASSDFDVSRGVVDVGSRIELEPGRILLAAIGTGLWSEDGDRPGVSAYLGVQLLF